MAFHLHACAFFFVFLVGTILVSEAFDLSTLFLVVSLCEGIFWLVFALHGMRFCLVIMSCMCPTVGAGRSIPMFSRPPACAVWPTLLEVMVFISHTSDALQWQ